MTRAMTRVMAKAMSCGAIPIRLRVILIRSVGLDSLKLDPFVCAAPGHGRDRGRASISKSAFRHSSEHAPAYPDSRSHLGAQPSTVGARRKSRRWF